MVVQLPRVDTTFEDRFVCICRLAGWLWRGSVIRAGLLGLAPELMGSLQYSTRLVSGVHVHCFFDPLLTLSRSPAPPLPTPPLQP